MTENEIVTIAVESAIEVHRTLGGPGLLDAVCVKKRSPSSFHHAGS